MAHIGWCCLWGLLAASLILGGKRTALTKCIANRVNEYFRSSRIFPARGATPLGDLLDPCYVYDGEMLLERIYVTPNNLCDLLKYGRSKGKIVLLSLLCAIGRRID